MSARRVTYVQDIFMLCVWAVERCNKDSEADQEGEVYVRNGGVWRNIDCLSEEKEGVTQQIW